MAAGTTVPKLNVLAVLAYGVTMSWGSNTIFKAMTVTRFIGTSTNPDNASFKSITGSGTEISLPCWQM